MWISTKNKTLIFVAFGLFLVVLIIVAFISIFHSTDDNNLKPNPNKMLIKATLRQNFNGILEKSLLSEKIWTISSLENNLLASGHTDGHLTIWNMQTGRILYNLTGHTDTLFFLETLSEGRLASGSYDYSVKIWNYKNGQLLRTLSGHTSFVMTLEALNDDRLASGSLDGTIKIWNVNTGGLIKSISVTNSVFSLAFLSNGNLAASSLLVGNVKIYNISCGEIVKTLESTASDNYLATLSDGNLAIGESNGDVGIYNSIDGSLLRNLKDDGDINSSVSWFVRLVALSDGRLISERGDGVIRIWNAQRWHNERSIYSNFSGSIKSIAVLSDGRLVAANYTLIKVWK